MRQYNVGIPFQRIAIDIGGHFRLMGAGNSYIMIMGDYFTKWMDTYAILNQEITIVPKALVSNFCPS